MANYSEKRNSQLKVRFGEELHEMLRASAKANSRSINTEIVHRLEASFRPSRTVAPELSRMLDQYIEAEVNSRLREIASQIGGGDGKA